VNRSKMAFSGWKVLALCFLSQNLAMGCAFGSFGPLLSSNEQFFGITRAAASAGLSCVLLATAFFSPLIGNLLPRISIKSAMIAGALLSALGYWGLALFPSFSIALVMYGVIGVGICTNAVLCPLLLVNRWFVSDKAKALSVVNLPMGLLVVPFVVGHTLPDVGRFTVLGVLGTIPLAFIPFILFMPEDPAHVGQLAHGATGSPNPVATAAGSADGESSTIHDILSKPAFWFFSLGMGIMQGAGGAFYAHFVGFGAERGVPLATASTILSLASVTGLFGTPLLGWIIDRIGPPTTLIFTALIQALMWLGMLYIASSLLFMPVGVLGVFLLPMNVLQGALISIMFPPNSTSRALGISYGLQLPFQFSLVPLAGLIFDKMDGYFYVFLIISALLGMASLSFVFMTSMMGGRTQSFKLRGNLH